MEQMIAMKEGLEAQIKAMSKPAKVNAGKFSSRTMARSGIEEEEPPPRRLNVGQMYRVIAKFVAVRSSPSIEAPFLRRLNNGAKVEMFEWDSSRSWRRVSVDCASDVEKKPKPRLSEAQRRWATEAPHWDNEKRCWVDRSKKVEVVDSDDDLVMKKDGWVMVHHPEMGLLLEAVSEIEDSTEENSAGAQEEAEKKIIQMLQPSSKEESFDYFWGSSSKVPVAPFKAVRRPAPGPGVVAKPAAGPVENAESEAKLDESALAAAMRWAAEGGDEEHHPEPEDVQEVPHVQGTRYRVIYKKVAVRRWPDTKAEAIRQLPQGELVEMYDWDETHAWRRIRILAIRDVADGGGMQEVDGWMLLESPQVGRLLEEVVEEGEDNDDDFAG